MVLDSAKIMNQTKSVARNDRPRWKLLFTILYLVCFVLSRQSAQAETDEASQAAAAAAADVEEGLPPQLPMEKPRIITVEELAKHDGEGPDGFIWLSILGEVYDVTKGVDYYKKGYGYDIFAGRDGSVPFVTGNFTEEECKKSLLDTLTDGEMWNLNTWREFYEKEEKYPFLGLLQGDYFDEDGGPTPIMTEIREMMRGYVPGKRGRKRGEKKAEEAKATEEMNLAASNEPVAAGINEPVEHLASKEGSEDDSNPKTDGVKGMVSSADEGEL